MASNSIDNNRQGLGLPSHAEDNRGLALGDLLSLAESSAIKTLSLAENIHGLTLEDESSTEDVEMARLLEVEVSSIELLNDVQLTDLLKRLLNLEARSAGIAQRAVEADHFFPASLDSATRLIVVYVRALLVV